MEARAQSDSMESVAYLKNGTVYRGKVIEQVFNESITIQTLTGEKVKISVSDLLQVTEEPKSEFIQEKRQNIQVKTKRRTWPEFHYPGRKFFFQGQVMLGFLEEGFRAIAGYRLGQFGILGGGVGVDFFQTGFSSQVNYTDPFDGVYFPVFAHYEGDMMKSRITPFYSIEAGYAFRADADNSYIIVTPLNHPVYKNFGGFTGEVGIGVKLYARHKIYVTWSADLDIKSATDKYSNYYYNSIGEDIKVSYSSASFFFMPVIKIGVGF